VSRKVLARTKDARYQESKVLTDSAIGIDAIDRHK
jgi:hypothetical protein